MLRNLRHAWLSFFVVATCAAAAYPERPVRYIVPGFVGGAPDISVRLLAAVVMGQVHVWIQGITVVEQHVKTGRIRGLAVTSLRRSPAFPELPTVAEAGLPGFEVAPWGGVVAPAGVPRAIVTRLNAEINKALAMPALQEKFVPLGVEVAGGTPGQFADHIRKETVKWAEVVRRAGLKPQ